MSAASNRRFIVAVAGDASAERDRYDLARSVGKAIVDAGCRVLTGGRGGVMEAASRGAHDSPKYREGDVVAVLPGNMPRQANQYADIVIPTGLAYARNAIVAHADALVAVGGGAGTRTEICYAWINKRLLICMRTHGASADMADAPVDHRTRFKSISNDAAFGADSAEQVRSILEKRLPEYAAALAQEGLDH